MPLDPRDPRFQKAFLGGIALLALLYLNFFTTLVPFTYKASASELNGLGTKYTNLSKDLNKARQATHRLPYLEKEYLLLHHKWEQSQSLLPSEEDMAWCLRTISLLGAQCGVQFTLFKPMPPKPAQYYTEHPIEIAVVGGYHEIGAFLSEIANLDRIINVSELELKAPKGARTPDEEPVEASFVASTYVLGGTGKPPEDTSKGKGQKNAAAPAAGGKAPGASRDHSGSSRGGE
ncbi:MAG TPA: type 4a pilus biogenesis protein PilO [Bacteroidota bacterium]|nr:type 4a pilus biogenesis protein PilO [Bacteroidota bacterium]